MRNLRRSIIVLVALLSTITLSAQKKATEPVDSLVRLLSAQSIEQMEIGSQKFRKVIGPARFFHNNTYLICDTALWNLNRETIEASGKVKILQNETVLTSDKLTYLIPQNLAQFRGTVVQLEDKDRNTLRTKHLDYNTKDSVAVFKGGGAFKDKDGQVIESTNGSYDSKIKTFVFTDNVNMFTDSIFVKTSRLDYNTNKSFATFGNKTDAWRDDNMLSSDAGWYDRKKELFLFNRNVHGMTVDREGWCDSLFYYRNTNNVEMLGHAQLTDTVRNVTGLAGRIVYTDSISLVRMMRDPAIVGITGNKGQPNDTVYVGADTLVYRAFYKFQIAENEFTDAEKRLTDINADAISAYRRKAAEEAAKAAEEAAMKNDPNYAAQQKAKGAQGKDGSKPGGPGGVGGGPGKSGGPGPGGPGPDNKGKKDEPKAPESEHAPDAAPLDSLSASLDSLGVNVDSLSAVSDSLARADSLAKLPKDSTQLGFMRAIKRVRLYRPDLQMACDSMLYNDVDSLVRLYKDPIVWNEGYRQYVADSIYVAFKNNAADRAYLMSEAFVTVEEAKDCYDQIRSTEMLAYFDTSGTLRRFDALGDVNTVFYIKEDSTFATVNKAQGKMMYAVFKDGDLQTVSYFDQNKNDAYPLAQMRKDDRLLKGFNWRPDEKPNGPKDVTKHKQRSTQRKVYAKRPKSQFKQTNTYFPGYMDGIYKQIADREKRKATRPKKKATAPTTTVVDSVAMKDSLAKLEVIEARKDSIMVADSLARVDSLAAAKDSLQAVADSISRADSLAAIKKYEAMSPKEKAKADKEVKKQQKAAERAKKDAAREAEWARLDSLDAAKAQAKLEKKKAKERARKLKALKRAQRQAEKDAARLEKYKRYYEKQKAIEDEKAAAQAAKDAEKAAAEAAAQAAKDAAAAAANAAKDAAASSAGTSGATDTAAESASD